MTFGRFAITLGLSGAVLLLNPVIRAQPRKPAATKAPANPAAVRVLDKEAERLQQEFVDGLVKLADGYESAGDLERARATLGKVLEIDPKRDSVQQRLDEMKNRVFVENEAEFEVDVTRSWVNTGLKVREGQPLRIAADGSYKFIVNLNLTPDGITTEDVQRDMVAGIKLGELMGVVLPAPKGKEQPKLGDPFAIGRQKEVTPEASGLLFLKVNIPGDTKSVGSVKVKLSGNFDR